MSNDKYYTPTIDEFHVGFIFETAIDYTEDGVKFPKEHPNCWYECEFDETEELGLIALKIENGDIRVKLLDQKDCEELGWEHIGSQWYQLKDVSGELGHWLYARFRKWGDNSFIKGYRSNPKDSNDSLNEQEFLFSGNIRNKSEMKILMKQTRLI